MYLENKSVISTFTILIFFIFLYNHIIFIASIDSYIYLFSIEPCHSYINSVRLLNYADIFSYSGDMSGASFVRVLCKVYKR